MLLSSSNNRGLLETQIRQVYDETGKPLNEIRMDLEHTGDVQKTIERIHNGQFLKNTPRDPSFKKRPMPLKQPSLSLPENEDKGNEGRDGKGKDIAKVVPQRFEVIDLCDSSDEAASPLQDSRKPPKFQPTKALHDATGRSDLSGSSSAILAPSSEITRLYADDTAISKPASSKFPASRYETPPLFRYSPSSTPNSSSPPPQDSPRSKRPFSPVALTITDSPTAATPQPSKKQKTVHVIDLDTESEPELPTSPRQPVTNFTAQKTSKLSETTRALLQEFADYSEDDSDDDSDNDLNGGKGTRKVTRTKAPPIRGRAAPTKRKSKDISVETDNYNEENEEHNSTNKRAKKGGRLSETEKARREAEKEEIRLLRQQEREAKAAEREEAKAQKKREREAKEAGKKREQELLSVNKLKTSKKDSAPEMIVDISTDLADSPLGNQLRRFLLSLGCEVNHEWRPAIISDSLCRVVKWRRKVKAEYSEEKGMFLPLPMEEVRNERHVLVYLTAKEFLDISIGTAHRDGLAEHVSRIKNLHPEKSEVVRLMYLIEGLEALSRKNKNNRNRQYQNRVRAQLGTGQGSREAVDIDIIDDDEIEDARLRLQVMHECSIHETQNGVESMEWISKFTGDISTIPYKKSRMIADTAFCTDVGQVKIGLGKADTYLRMLEEINRVTPSVANGVASKYPDVQALVNAFKLHGENALENLPNIATRDGLPMNRNIGAACSKRIYGIFMGTDPSDTDV